MDGTGIEMSAPLNPPAGSREKPPHAQGDERPRAGGDRRSGEHGHRPRGRALKEARLLHDGLAVVAAVLPDLLSLLLLSDLAADLPDRGPAP